MYIYKNLNDFIKMLETKPKTTTIAVEKKLSVSSDQSRNIGRIMVSIPVDGYVYGYVSDPVAEINLLPDDFYELLTYCTNDEATLKKIQESYNTKVMTFNGMMKAECEKVEAVMKGLGFANVISDLRLV